MHQLAEQLTEPVPVLPALQLVRAVRGQPAGGLPPGQAIRRGAQVPQQQRHRQTWIVLNAAVVVMAILTWPHRRC